MVTFTVGVGLSNSLTARGFTWGGDTYSGSYPSIKAGTKAWWPNTPAEADHVADLWHAAINSRGQFFSVDNPTQLVSAFNAVINRVQVGTGSGGGLAANASTFSLNKNMYQATYKGTVWTGELKKISLASDGTLNTTPVWSAATQLATPNASTRVVLSYSGTAGIPFRWDNITASQKSALNGTDSATTGEARLNWIRGDASNEGIGLNFRARSTTKLGDIVGSNPVYVGVPGAAINDPTYADFRFSNCPEADVFCTGTRTPMIYVGANDGMLHGFRDSDGEEKLAYVPSAVFDNLKDLTNPYYQHKFFVDAPPIVGDVKIGSDWKTMLIGAMGAGGRGIYALDVTDPSTFSESNASSIVKWEFGPTIAPANETNLGYIYGKPVIAKMQNGKWAAIFGNGYNSTGDGKSSLFIVFFEDAASGITSSSYVRLPVGSGTTSSPGGLAKPLAVDSDLDGSIDTIYAGDVDGKLWKFDVSAATSSTWATANSSLQPIYTATDASGNPQPISTAPAVMLHPRGGMFVIFGTGRNVTTTDGADTHTQTLYGVWDNPAYATRPIPKSLLEARTFTNSSTATGYRTIDGNTITWYTATDATSKLGWHANLIDTGERIVNNPAIENGAIVFSSSAPDTDICTGGGASWLIVLDAITGKATSYSPFDVNNDGKFDLNTSPTNDKVDGKVGTGKRWDAGTGVGGDVRIGNPEATGCNTFVSGSTGQADCARINYGTSSGRLNWRDLAQ